nr:protein suppressor of K(+) transport growth defect 1-like [Tanacetum cinerariifolium]
MQIDVKPQYMVCGSIFNRHVCSNGQRGKPAGNGGDTGVATRTKPNKNNGDRDGDGDDVEQNKLMASDFLLYPFFIDGEHVGKSQVSKSSFFGSQGLDVAVSDEDLKQLFSQFGEIVSMKIPIAKG